MRCILWDKGEQNGGDLAKRGEDLEREGIAQYIFEGYGGRKEKLYSYVTLVGVFNLVFAVFLLVAKSLGRSIPERMDLKDLVLLGVATHKLSLTGTQDAVTSPLRAPFTEFQEKESPKSVQEKPRGGGLRRSIGELVPCQFCLACG